MAIIKEVRIKVSSVIENLDAAGLAEGEAERAESVTVGYLHIFDNERLLTYAEEQEGARTVTEIKLLHGTVRVLRHGAIESDIIFDEGATHRSVYSVVPYKFDAEVTTKRIRDSLTECGGALDLFYNMKIGGAQKQCRMKITVTDSKLN